MAEAQSLGLLAVWGAFMGLFVLVGIALYVLFSFGLFTLANRRNVPNAWLAWIPIAQFYILGEVIGPVKLGSYEITQTGAYLLGAMVGLWILSMIPFLGMLFGVANMVVGVGALYFLFSRYTRENTPILYTVLSVVLPFMGPIFVFMIRNNEYIASDISSVA